MAKDRKPSQIERDRRVIARMYLKGRVQAEIAAELKINQSTVSRELKLLVEEWKVERVYDINEWKARELAKIDSLELEYWQAWERSQTDALVRSKKVVQDVGGDKKEAFERTEARVGDPRFLDGVQWCIDKRCAIIGVEAPKRIAADPQINFNVNWDELTPDQIARIRNARDIVEIKEIVDDKSSGKS